MIVYKKTSVLFFLMITFTVHAFEYSENNYKDRISLTSQDENPIVFFKNFLKWYKTKVDYLNHHIFPVAMDFKNNAPYRINFKETEKYLSVLKTSGFFSNNYLNNKRAYFNKIDITLQHTKQNDGTVDGLDYDPILYSQEPESILENLNNIKLAVVNSEKNEVVIKMNTAFGSENYCLFSLKKDGWKYLIDKIDIVSDGKVLK